MTLALFDLDNTLLAGDSDHAWGAFIVTKGMADRATHEIKNNQFYRDYQMGTLDPWEYQNFALQPLRGRSVAAMQDLQNEFLWQIIQPMRLAEAERLIEEHRRTGDRLVIVTATNRVVVEPIADAMGIADLLCSEPEVVDGHYTGKLLGEPCMGPGKVNKLERWLEATGESLEGATFYSDSHNDVPLLERVPNPVAVDPDDRLASLAEERGWPVISLRHR